MSNVFQICLKGFKVEIYGCWAKNGSIGWTKLRTDRTVQLNWLRGAKTFYFFQNACSIGQGWTSTGRGLVEDQSRAIEV